MMKILSLEDILQFDGGPFSVTGKVEFESESLGLGWARTLNPAAWAHWPV